MKKFLTARTTVLVIFLLLAACLGIAVIIPQNGADSWYAGNRSLAAVVRGAGLDHVFSTWWFLLLAALFLLSLLFSTFDQYRIARRKMLTEGRLRHGEDAPLLVSPDAFRDTLRRFGYRRLGGSDGSRYVRSPWGYWGNFLLHVGLALAVLFAVVYVATENRLQVRVVAGEDILLTRENAAEQRGLLAGNLPLPASIHLEELLPEFWENDALRSLASRGTFGTETGEERYRVAVNDSLSYRGMKIYQSNRFGTACYLTFAETDGRSFDQLLFLPHQPGRDRPAYGTAELPYGKLTLKGKFLADAGHGTVFPRNPLLVVRLLSGEKLLGEAPLRQGESAVVGPYRVGLRKTAWWTEYIIEGSRGTAGIFSGFALILAGVFLTYFSSPRVVFVEERERLVSWQSGRFNDFYREERDRVFAAARGEDTE